MKRIAIVSLLLIGTLGAMALVPPAAKIGVGIGCIVISYGVMRMAAGRSA